MEEKKLMPKRRFSGLENDWLSIPLREFRMEDDKYSYTGGPFGSDLKTSDYIKKGIRIIQLQNIGDGFFNDDYKIYTSEAKAESLSSSLIYPDDIIIAKMAEPLARAAIIPDVEPKYLMASDGIRLKVDKNKYNNYFILTIINHKNFRENAIRNSTGTTRKRIGLVTLGNLLSYVPEFQEQQKIGKFFKVLDDRIANQERKISKVKALKEAYLTEMFPQEGETVPKRRFGGFEGEWLGVTIRDTMDINSGMDYKHLKLGNIPVYGTGGYMLSVNDQLSTSDGIGIGRKGTIDKPRFLKAPFWTVDTLFYMIPKKDYDIYYLYYLSNTIKWRKYDESTGVPSLSKDTIENISIMTPIIKEQQKIGQFFKNLDNQIQAEEAKLEKVKKMKEAYLEEMFV